MMAMTSVPAMAQEEGETTYPTIETGYFRIVHNGYGDVLNVDKKYGFSLNATENDARTMPGSIFYYDTDGLFSFAEAMEQLGENISVADLMTLMATSSWKSGSYSTYDMTSQAVSLGGYLKNLGRYTKTVLANFSESDEVKDFYENGPAWYLSVAMTGVFYPADMGSLEAFMAAVRRFLTRWAMFFDG